MEFARTLYRVHERMLKAEGIRKIVDICYCFTFVLSITDCFKLAFFSSYYNSADIFVCKYFLQELK